VLIKNWSTAYLLLRGMVNDSPGTGWMWPSMRTPADTIRINYDPMPGPTGTM